MFPNKAFQKFAQLLTIFHPRANVLWKSFCFFANKISNNRIQKRHQEIQKEWTSK